MATQTERSFRTKSALLGATIHVLAEHGYAALSEVRVCEQAGVSRGALRHHFPCGRYDLLAELVQQLIDAECEQLEALGPLTPKERLHLMLRGLLADPSSNTAVAVLEIWMASRGDAQLAQRTEATFEQVITRLFGHDGVAADPEEVALRAFLHGASLHRLSSDFDVTSLADAVRWMLALLPVPPKVAALMAARG
ncbi:TetR/AcrR family transcriptional regulator [Chitinibacteraceae bacterium HSL-7]